MQVRLLQGQDVARLLPMPIAIERMRKAFSALSAGRALMPHRSRVDLDHGDMHLMPSCLGEEDPCVKVVLTYAGNRERGLPLVQGVLMMFDSATGTPRALLNCGPLTAIRTGAAGGLAVDVLARPDSATLGLIGAGVQARMQAEAAMAVRSFQQVLIFDICREAAEGLRAALLDRARPPKIELADSADAAARGADVLVTATTSCEPTFDGDVVRPGTHINAIGSYRPEAREVDAATVERAYVVADSREACVKEAGDLIIPGRKPDAELGEVINGAARGRADAEEITLFKSVGLAVQDAASASWVLQEAERLGVGTLVDL